MKRPHISVIIPTFNRNESLARCLRALAQQDYSRDAYEVIVVDDGGAIAPVHEVDSVGDQMEIRLISQVNAGPASARNRGAFYAKGDYLAFTDDDCIPCSDWLSSMSRRFTQDPQGGIGGKVTNALPDNIYATTSQLLADYLCTYYNRIPGEALLITSNNLAVPKDGFQRVGGFDTTFPQAAGEDREFCRRWREYNLSLTFAPEIEISHAHHLNLRDYLKQHYYYGKGAYHFRERQAQRNNQRIRFEPLRFYADILRMRRKDNRFSTASRINVLLAFSQASNGVGFFRSYCANTGRFVPKSHSRLSEKDE